MPEKVILLVGGNPLPNYVAALALKEKRGIEKVHLLWTPEVEDVKKNLMLCLKERYGFGSLEETYIPDAGDASGIRSACEEIVRNSHLHYTGGTNVMAAHIHAVWTEYGGKADQASYLFGGVDRLMTDNGGKILMENIQLDLETLRILHGLTCAHWKNDARLPDDANEIAAKVFKVPDLADRLYKRIPDGNSAFKKNPFCPRTEGLCLSKDSIPCQDQKWDSGLITTWRKFLRGEWLEDWVYQQVKATELIPAGHLHVDIGAKIAGREFQLDVVAIRGHHLYVVSCSIDRDIRMCKSKLFEVAMRSRQLGGDLARSALVCLADRCTVEKLERDVHSLSESSRVPQVFGLDQVREWAGYNRSTQDLRSLMKWLNS